MNHPELVYTVAQKHHIPVQRLIHDAFCYFEVRRHSWNATYVFNAMRDNRSVPQIVEDYALELLRGTTYKDLNLQFHEPLSKDFKDWKRRKHA
jgi:hypothetical protein